MLGFETDANSVEKIDGISHAFPYTMHNRDLTHFIVPWHWHEEVEFDYVMEGAVTIHTVNGAYTMKKGEAYFINSNVMDTKCKADGYTRAVECAHLFHPILLGGHFQSVFYQKYLEPILKNQQIEILVITNATESGEKYLQKLLQLTELQQRPDQEFQIRNLLSETWLILMEEARRQLDARVLPKRYKQDSIRAMLSYIHQNYREEITIGAIAKHAGVSERECSRLFKEIIQKTPFDYIMGYRIEAAKNMLLKTDDSITSIAFHTGFHNSSYFGKVFKRSTQLTPMEYRQKYR